MKTFHLASYNRASNGAIEHLRKELEKRKMLKPAATADYIIAVGDRTETFDVVLHQWRCGVPIIHLWAGEVSGWNVEDEVYRHSLTLMSMMQLCTNEKAKDRVTSLCKAVGKKSNVHIVGNVYLDDLSINESKVPKEPYILVLYNPPTLLEEQEVRWEIVEVSNIVICMKMAEKIDKHIWIEPNGDINSKLLEKNVNQINLPREQFLGLLKNCKYFITNSSCQFYEAPFFLKPKQIISVGVRNKNRESKHARMNQQGATEKIIKLLSSL